MEEEPSRGETRNPDDYTGESHINPPSLKTVQHNNTKSSIAPTDHADYSEDETDRQIRCLGEWFGRKLSESNPIAIATLVTQIILAVVGISYFFVYQGQLDAIKQQLDLQSRVAGAQGANIHSIQVTLRWFKNSNEIQGIQELRNQGEIYPDSVSAATAISFDPPAPQDKWVFRDLEVYNRLTLPPRKVRDYKSLTESNESWGYPPFPTSKVISLPADLHKVVYVWGEVRYQTVGVNPIEKVCYSMPVYKFIATARQYKERDKGGNLIHPDWYYVNTSDMDVCQQ